MPPEELPLLEDDELELDELLEEELELLEFDEEELLLEELEELLLEDELELPQSLLLNVIQFRLNPLPNCTRKVCMPAAMFTGPEVSVIQFCQPPVLPTDSAAIC